MPLNRPALPLGPGPRGVQDARRWVVQTCRDIGRPELTECAEMGVSELVTNALLHGEPPLSVRVRGTREHPRVEVRDGSTRPPVLPSDDTAEGDDILLTFGRGLDIVARSSDAWGAAIEEDGKIVWFAPAVDFADESTPGVITGVDPQALTPIPEADAVDIEILDVPVDLYQGFHRHFCELRREVRLLALAHETDYPLAKSLSDLFAALERSLRDGLGAEQVQAAEFTGQEYADVYARISRRSATTLSRFLEALELADAFCREERLLSLARSPEQRAFQSWFLGEYVRQTAGEEPLPWRHAADVKQSADRKDQVSRLRRHVS